MRAVPLMSSPQTSSQPIWGQHRVLSEIHLSKHCVLLAIYKMKSRLLRDFSRGSSSPQLGLHSAPHFSAHVLICLLPLILIDHSPTCSVPTSRSFQTHKFNMPFRFQWVISQNSIIWQVRHLTSSHSKCKTNKIKAQMLAYTIGLPELCDTITTKPLLTSESWFVK